MSYSNLVWALLYVCVFMLVVSGLAEVEIVRTGPRFVPKFCKADDSVGRKSVKHGTPQCLPP